MAYPAKNMDLTTIQTKRVKWIVNFFPMFKSIWFICWENKGPQSSTIAG